MASIVSLLVSREHRYTGRPDPAALPHEDDTVERVEIRAGVGIVGDRYAGRRAHRDAAITVQAAEALSAFDGADLRQTRRNVLLRGVELGDEPDRVLVLDSGDGPVRLRLRRPARPCGWMDAAMGPGARKALRDGGGWRCEPLTDGVLTVGPVEARWS